MSESYFVASDPNDCVFPSPPGDWDNGGSGLTLREHFAVLAMQGLLARFGNWSAVPNMAVVMADALIEALNPNHLEKSTPPDSAREFGGG